MFELFVRYGAHFRDIGHKAIFVANSWRTLQCIGWQHAEPVLRSLAYALQEHGNDNPAKGDAPADRPWRRNKELAAKIQADWQEGKPSDGATADMLAMLRQGSDEEACEKVVALLNKGVAPQSMWDALFAGAGELLMHNLGLCRCMRSLRRTPCTLASRTAAMTRGSCSCCRNVVCAALPCTHGGECSCPIANR